MKKRYSLLLIFLLCQVLTANAQTPAAIPITLDGTALLDTFTLPLDTSKPWKLSLASDTPYTLKMDGKLLSNQLKKAFYIYTNDPNRPAVNIRVDLKILAKPGTYELAIPFNKVGSDVQFIHVAMVRPAATIDTLSTVSMAISGNTPSVGTALVLKETGKLSAVNDLVIHPPYFSSINDTNLITFRPGVYHIDAGGILQIIYTKDLSKIDKLPLGPNKGIAQITSPNLSAPMLVPFEIINKRSAWWICVVILLGQLAALLTRHYLADKKAWEEKRAIGFTFIEKIHTDSAQIQDAGYRSEVNALLSGVAVLLEKNGGMSYFTGIADEDINAKIQEVTTKYNELKAAFEKKLRAQNDSMKALAGSIGDPQLQPLVKNAVADARVSIDAVRERLAVFDSTGAEQPLNLAISSTNLALHQLKAYLLSVQQELGKDTFYPASIPVPLKDAVKNELGTIMNAMPVLAEKVADPATLTTLVTAMDQISRQINALIGFFIKSLDSAYKLPADKSNPAVVAFMQTLEDWKGILTNISTNAANSPNAATYMDTTLVAKVDSEWQAIVALGILAFGGAAAAFNFQPGTQPQSTPAYQAADVPDADSAVWKRLEEGAVKSRKNRTFYGLIQTAILAVILCMIAYNTYGPKFIGTFDELLVIFLFAFSIDTSIDTVLKYKTGKIA